jgi:hypothetical protein
MTDEKGAHRWFSTDCHAIPTKVWCPKVGYPNEDEHGRVQYRNTHFETEDAAWENGQRSVDAGLSLEATDVKRLREALASAEAALVERTLERDEFNAARASAEKAGE